MAALTSAPSYNIIKKAGSSIPLNYVVCSAKRIWANAFVGLPGTAALTACRGYAVPWANESTIQWLGKIGRAHV